MSEPCIMEAEIATLQANDKNMFAQILEVKEEVKVLNRLVVSVERIAAQTDQTAKKVDNIDTRLEKIESEPEDQLIHIKNAVISAIVTGVVGALLGAVLALVLK